MPAATLADPTTVLLDYALVTTPTPLYASPKDGEPQLASIDIMITNTGNEAVYCKQITIALPLGDLAQDLVPAGVTSIKPSIDPHDDWSIEYVQDDVLLALPQDEYYTFAAKSTSESGYGTIDTDAIVIHLTGVQINEKIGTTAITITEDTTTDTTTWPDPRSLQAKLIKFPYQPTQPIQNFHADRSQIGNSDTATLSWDGPTDQVHYEIWYDGTDSEKAKNPVQGTNWTTPQLSKTTTFTLHAQVQGEGVETKDYYLTTTVPVDKPDLTVKSLTADENLNGPPNVRIRSLAGPIGTPLSLDTPVNLNGDFNGDFTVTKDNVTRITTGGDNTGVEINGGLHIATGTTKFEDDVTVTKGVGIDGDLTVTGGCEVGSKEVICEGSRFYLDVDGLWAKVSYLPDGTTYVSLTPSLDPQYPCEIKLQR
ncbi:hypothetical protein [Streptomyces noursei]|uniref:hypothetical protein n=1 Tax=Streptomyces noursei TaxID=1971 RepID=UPI00167BDCB1|nr:hypothetical protein [Streptomyces noursei]MCZ1021297.1 hypothetical protein [Streptomyces noursei]GGX55679.1 hypothetical protein GCM10010341_90580 [Streptomyces noursei]